MNRRIRHTVQIYRVVQKSANTSVIVHLTICDFTYLCVALS